MNTRKLLTALGTVLIFGGVVFLLVALYHTTVAFINNELPPIQANLAEIGGMIWTLAGAFILRAGIKTT